MPNYVAAKQYYRRILGDCIHDVAYLVPPTDLAYEYDHPDGTGHDIPPFASLWFCGVGRQRMVALKELFDNNVDYNNDNDDDHTTTNVQFTNDHYGHNRDDHRGLDRRHRSSTCRPVLVTSLEELADLGIVSLLNRPNPRQRRKKRKKIVASTSSNTNMHENKIDKWSVGGVPSGEIGHPTTALKNKNNNNKEKMISPPSTQVVELHSNKGHPDKEDVTRNNRKAKQKKSGSKYRDESGKRKRKRF
jgi:hypothetical protein